MCTSRLYLFDFYKFHVTARQTYVPVSCKQFKTYSEWGGHVCPFVNFHDRGNSTVFEQILYELYQAVQWILFLRS